MLSEIAIREENKTLTGIKELDRVLGGGIVQGSLTLEAETPVSVNPHCYCRSAITYPRRDIKYCIFPVRNPRYRSRCGRTVWGLFRSICCYCVRTNLDIISEVIRKSKPEVVIIDSIQTMYNENVSAAREACLRCVNRPMYLCNLQKDLIFQYLL